MADSPITVDGKLDDAAWQKAPVASAFIARKSGTTAEIQTELRVMFDDQYLYLGVVCHEPQPTAIVPTSNEPDNERSIWRTDVVAALIRPAADSDTYYQFAVSAGGMTFDQKNAPEGRFYEDFEPEWTARSVIGADRWTSEWRLPLAVLGATPQMGTPWRLNVMRVRQASATTSFWSPSISAHDPEQLGRVEDIVIGAEARGLQLRSVVLGDGAVGANRLQALLTNTSAKSASVDGRLLVTAPDGMQRGYPLPPLTLPASGTETLSVPYQLAPCEGRHLLRLQIASADGSLHYRSPPGTVALRGLLDAYSVLNYYTREAEAEVVCLVSDAVDDATLAQASITASLGNNVVAKCQAPAERRVVLRVPLNELEVGSHELELKMYTGSPASEVAAQQVAIQKLPPAAADSTRIVRQDAGAYMRRDGSPYFLLGNILLYQHIGDTDVVQEMADAGFTTIFWWRGSHDVDGTLALMDAAHKVGMTVVVSVHHLWPTQFRQYLPELKLLLSRKAPLKRTPKDPAAISQILDRVDELRARLERLKGHPALLAWGVADEPGIARMPQVRLGAQIIREVDPYRPRMLLTGPSATSLNAPYRREVASVYETHTYLHGTRPMITTYDRARRGAIIADRDRAMHISMLTGRTSWSYRGLTATEQRCEAYLGLIGGWQGHTWFRGRHQRIACWVNVQSVARELSALAPLFASNPPTFAVATEQPDGDPVKAVRIDVDGQSWLLAANSQNRAVDVQFKMPESAAEKTVAVWREKRSIATAGGAFTDAFEPFAVHIYQLP
jgi:hypothetical protein